MKKIFLLVVTLACTTFANVGIGAFAGLNLTSGDYDIDVDKNLKIGQVYAFGAIVEVPINQRLSIESGLSFNSRVMYNTLYATTDEGYDQLFNTWAKFLELPITARVNFGFRSLKPYITAGIYMGLGVGGKYSYEGSEILENGSIRPYSYTEDIEWGTHLNRFDIGLTFKTGIEFKRPWFIGYGLKLGFNELRPKSGVYNLSIKNSSMAIIEFGYMFGK